MLRPTRRWMQSWIRGPRVRMTKAMKAAAAPWPGSLVFETAGEFFGTWMGL
jgi:hypothetical protein